MRKQIIFITGTSSGLGKALAQLCHEKGHTVYGSSRNPGAENNTFAELKMDVTDPESVEKAIQYILEKEGKIDVVVNNAGLGILGPIEYLSMEDIQQVWQTNVNGLIHVVKSVLPGMRQQNTGKIIAISSIAAEIALPYRGIYCASKAAGDKIIQSLRHELSTSNIKLCSLQAGDIRTAINDHRIKVSNLKDPFYAEIVRKTNDHVDAEVNKGLSAQQVAAEIYHLMAREDLPVRHIVGKPLQKISLWIKRIVSDRIFEKMIATYSG
jgi:NADP-dependent 3-hydroxy acid dehydrogenase YdfG